MDIVERNLHSRVLVPALRLRPVRHAAIRLSDRGIARSAIDTALGAWSAMQVDRRNAEHVRWTRAAGAYEPRSSNLSAQLLVIAAAAIAASWTAALVWASLHVI